MLPELGWSAACLPAACPDALLSIAAGTSCEGSPPCSLKPRHMVVDVVGQGIDAAAARRSCSCVSRRLGSDPFETDPLTVRQAQVCCLSVPRTGLSMSNLSLPVQPRGPSTSQRTAIASCQGAASAGQSPFTVTSTPTASPTLGKASRWVPSCHSIDSSLASAASCRLRILVHPLHDNVRGPLTCMSQLGDAGSSEKEASDGKPRGMTNEDSNGTAEPTENLGVDEVPLVSSEAESTEVQGGRSSGGVTPGKGTGTSLRESDELLPSAAVSDWRAFRARLVASENAEARARPGDGGLGIAETLGEKAGDIANVSLDNLWAHALYAPEKGCLLVASELLHGYNFFQRSVILLLGVGTGPSDGPYGIALNKPFPRTVAQVDSILPGLATTFGSCHVHVGGPIGPRTVLLVHGHDGLDGHCEVLPGVSVAGLAGLPAAAQLVESGKAKAEDFQVVLGYAGWGEEQLRQEIEQGWWYVAACSHDVILGAQKQCCGGEGDRFWKEILHLMGGEYAEVGNRCSGESS